MHNNYFFLRHLSQELKAELPGYKVVSCYSQVKDELLIVLRNEVSFFHIKANLSQEFSCLSFPEDHSRSRKNSADLFPELLGKSVIDVVVTLNDRSFTISFEDELQLLFKLHGNRSNLVLLRNDDALSLFKKKMKDDLALTPAVLARQIDQSREHFLNAEGNLAVIFPTFGPVIKSFLSTQKYELAKAEEKWKMVKEILDTMEKPSFIIATINERTTLTLLEHGDIINTHKSALTAINDFYSRYTKERHIDKVKKRIMSQLQKQQRQAHNYLLKAEQELGKLLSATGHKEIADIIMANLQQVPAGATEVELFNFYTNKGVTIKLKSTLSAQKNAENYYRKAKNQKMQVAALESSIVEKKSVLSTVKQQLEDLATTDSVSDLNVISKSMGAADKASKEEKNKPFKSFSFMGYNILVGKNAKSNDELTSKFAKKDDLWLHAKDVSGSHVVIKHQSGNNYPKPVIEKAAELAGYYSKRKSDTTCPVIYTARKYVRKRKGDPPGTVVVEKEKVILVEPRAFDS